MGGCPVQTSGTGRLLVALLLAVLLLQAWTLSRQNQFQRQLNALANRVGTAEKAVGNRLDTLDRHLRSLAEAEQWIAIADTTVQPGAACESATVQVEWNLLQWSPGTQSRLLYRLGRTGEWQEAKLSGDTGPGYSAGFTVPVEPMIVTRGVHIARRTGSAGRAEERMSSEGNRGPVVQYQIVSEGPAGSRSTGVRDLDLSRWFALYAMLEVEVDRENRYGASAIFKHPETPCLQVERAAVRTYAGDRLVQTIPLTGDARERLGATWQSEAALTRLEFVLQHPTGTSTLPVDLPAP